MIPKFVLVAAGLASLTALGLAGLGGQTGASKIHATAQGPVRKDKVVLSDAQWKRRLSPKAYYILRQEGTERAGSSPLLNVHAPGVFSCAGCGLPLYRTADKFDSGTGWPSFVKPIVKDAVWYKVDGSLGEVRNEVRCARCDGHLGHVFDDGPANRGGLRYCMDGDALLFSPDKK